MINQYYPKSKSNINPQKPISKNWDPWDPLNIIKVRGKYELTSVELTVTNLCNLRCEYCAVGDELTEKEDLALPVDFIIKRLDEIQMLDTISITGGEPTLNPKIVRNIIKPILKYAKSRGLYTQINSNLTLPLSRYEDWIEYIDVLHMSYNYLNLEEFHKTVFHNSKIQVSIKQAEILYNRIIENAKSLSKDNIFVSAETLLSRETFLRLSELHNTVALMGAKRHEIHPLYASGFGKSMNLISLVEYKASIEKLIADEPRIWILLGTVPIFPCSDNVDERDFWYKLQQNENLTIRQDPDGRNRLNLNIFTGNVYVTDFGSSLPLGNIQTEQLDKIFKRFRDTDRLDCMCLNVGCLGPNKLVANSYYEDVDFSKRKAK